MTTLQIIDDYFARPVEMRGRVLAGEFGTQTGPDGAKYTNINVAEMPELFPPLERALRAKVEPKLAVFRVDLDGELPHCPVHSDEICATHAGILYLNTPEQCRGGTAFWRHKRTGLEEMPEGVGPLCIHELKQLNLDWHDASQWEQTTFVPMKFNRFITYPTRMFHSRWPLEGFGTSKENGRLIWTLFYDRD